MGVDTTTWERVNSLLDSEIHRMGDTGTPGVGIIASNPGDSEEDSGHIATRMIVSVLLHFHDEVHVFTRSTAVLDFEDSSVSVHRIDKPFHERWWLPRLVGQFVYQVRFSLAVFRYRRDVDLIIISSSGMLIPVLASRLSQVYVIYRVGGFLFAELPETTFVLRMSAKFLRKLEHVIYRLSNTILVLSPSMLDSDDFASVREKTHVWNHYYFDDSSFSKTTPYDEREAVIGHVGVSEVKGTLNFLDGVSRLPAELIDKLVIVGDGPAMRQAVERAESMPIPVDFTGRIDRDQMVSEYNRMKLLVISSRSEGVPKVALEAIACGTPVLATRVGGIPDYIEHGENGFLVDSNEPEALANSIEVAINSRNLQIFSERAYLSVEDEFSFRQTAREYQAIITQETPFIFPAAI